MMKIAIHHRKGSFSDRWITYCKENQIPYKIVNCYNSEIIEQLKDCSALMWHFHHASPKDILLSKQLLFAVALSGKKIFPDVDTMWHFDDKVAQKYLLESINIETVPTHVFYDKKEALTWLNLVSFPKVFKLRGGAGAKNVFKVDSRSEARTIVKKAFSKGFNQYNGWSGLKERIRKYKNGKSTFLNVLKGVYGLFFKSKFSKIAGNEIGYIYFQDFIPYNDHDIRVIVINEKAFAIKRMIRENDFRASGSGFILYEKELFEPKTIELSFEYAKKLKSQCVAFDFIYENEKPLVVEISYGFTTEVYDKCPGYWTSDMKWHEGKFIPQNWMVDLMK